MFVSVLICTRNRADSLRQTLNSVFDPTNLRSPDWEVVVVDNNSDDHTAQVCRDYQATFPGHFRFLVEKKLGKSRALNAAIAAARGEVLAFTDDDVLFASDYLGGIRTVFTQHTADAAQGRVLLDCEGGWPKWLDESYALMADFRDFGDEVIDLEGTPVGGTLCGTNMIVRADVFSRISGFSPDLGPGGIGVYEDTEISLRMRQAGCHLIYAPQILIRHQWQRDRLTKSFIRWRLFLHGRINAYYEPLPTSFFRFGLYVVKETIAKELVAIWNLCAGRPTLALHCQCEARLQAGLFWQHWLFKRGVPRRWSPGVLEPRVEVRT